MEISIAERLLDSARVAFGIGQYLDALRIVDLALSATADEYEVLCLKASILSALDRDAESLELCDRAIEVSPETPDGYWRKASTVFNMGRFVEAEELFRTTLKLLRRNSQEQSDPLELEYTYVGLADSLSIQGKRTEAMTILAEGIAACDSELMRDLLKKASSE